MKRISVHYIADPMCSWCYGFRRTLRRFKPILQNEFSGHIKYRLSGLAPDSTEPMPQRTRLFIQSQWREITASTGIQFNWNFWTVCQPRRSTYNACRAVITARAMNQALELPMFEAIQTAYYLRALNPSDTIVLADLAVNIGLDRFIFEKMLKSVETETILAKDIEFRASLGHPQFPSLALETSDHEDKYVLLSNGFVALDEIVNNLKRALARP